MFFLRGFLGGFPIGCWWAAPESYRWNLRRGQGWKTEWFVRQRSRMKNIETHGLLLVELLLLFVDVVLIPFGVDRETDSPNATPWSPHERVPTPLFTSFFTCQTNAACRQTTLAGRLDRQRMKLLIWGNAQHILTRPTARFAKHIFHDLFLIAVLQWAQTAADKPNLC